MALLTMRGGMIMATVDDKLVDAFAGGEDVIILKKDGSTVDIRAGSLSIFADPISGRDDKGRNVSILKKDISDVISEF